uniref:Exosome complex component 10 n=1 Tax=Arcella intermedia TaxID=1963864 RepID=A0A6B2KXI9_9EUKA
MIELTGGILRKTSEEKKGAPVHLGGVEDFAEKLSDVVEVMDDLLESVDMFVDGTTAVTDTLKTKHVQFQRKNDPRSTIFHAQNIPRPQEKWRADTDNGYGPFIPKMDKKFHARRPLDESITKARASLPKDTKEKPITASDISAQILNFGLLKGQNSTQASFPHPYQYELVNLEITNDHLMPAHVQMYKDITETACVWVTTVPQLEELVKMLSKEKEIAIDLEHHSYRSFHGFTCLMQLSTREVDFLIDCLELRLSMWKLNEIFTNPAITKVLHGADKDVEWLQHDFGVYIVNMFDTGQASRVLEYPFFSLAYLLKHFCKLDVDKKYQLADWRIRPLPDEMQKYAREDTHYLLYIYDSMKNEAIEKGAGSANLLRSIWLRSRDVCLIKYENPVFTPDSYKYLLKLHNTLDDTQTAVFATLYEWRDRTARMEDESVAYVLPNHMMYEIAAKMPLDVNSLFDCCKPVPPCVKNQAAALCQLIQTTKMNPYKFRNEEVAYHTYAPQVQQFYSEVDDFTGMEFMSYHPPSPKPNLSLTSPTSPVLSTEQLYETANWTDMNLDSLESLVSSRASLSKKNQQLDAQSPGKHSLFVYDSDEEELELRVPLEEDEGVKSARRIARTIARSWFSSPMKAANQAFSDNSIEIARPIPFDLSKSTDLTTSSESMEPKKVEENEEMEEMAVEESEGTLEDIPKSMEEIYKLSNKTRVQKKEKKKMKRKVSGGPESPLLIKSGFGNQKSDLRREANKKQNDDAPEDPEVSIDFMRSIGWMEPEAVPPQGPVGQLGSGQSFPSLSELPFIAPGEAKPRAAPVQQPAPPTQNDNPYTAKLNNWRKMPAPEAQPPRRPSSQPASAVYYPTNPPPMNARGAGNARRGAFGRRGRRGN